MALAAEGAATGLIAEDLAPAAKIIQILPKIVIMIAGIEHIHLVGAENAVVVLIHPGVYQPGCTTGNGCAVVVDPHSVAVSGIGTGNVFEAQFPKRIITILQRKVNRKCAATAIFGKRHKRKESEL